MSSMRELSKSATLLMQKVMPTKSPTYTLSNRPCAMMSSNLCFTPHGAYRLSSRTILYQRIHHRPSPCMNVKGGNRT